MSSSCVLGHCSCRLQGCAGQCIIGNMLSALQLSQLATLSLQFLTVYPLEGWSVHSFFSYHALALLVELGQTRMAWTSALIQQRHSIKDMRPVEPRPDSLPEAGGLGGSDSEFEGLVEPKRFEEMVQQEERSQQQETSIPPWLVKSYAIMNACRPKVCSTWQMLPHFPHKARARS